MIRFRCVFIAAVLLLAGYFTASAQQEFAVPDLDSALGYWNMRQADFISDRVWAEDDTFLLPVIREALQSPHAAYGLAKALSAAVPQSVAEAGRVNDMARLLAASCPDVVCRDIDAQLAAAAPTAVDPFEPMFSAFALAEGYRSQAFTPLTPAQRQALLLAAPLWFADEQNPADDSLKGSLPRSFGLLVDTTQHVDSDSVLTLLALVNRDALSAAIYAFARGLALTVENWKRTQSPFSATLAPGVDGLVLASRQTRYGTFVLGGSGPNVYSGDFALIIDLGGDDHYASRAGAAVNGLGHSVSAVIDMAGNDIYRCSKMAGQACGVMGLGAIVDLAGDDNYIGGSFAQAAAFCGAGLLFDGGGNDTYRAGLFAQGAAVCGIAVLADAAGRDVYDVWEYGQGFASTFAAAALVDGGGNDVYRAGGLDSHAPLRPEDFRSFAQGFAIGHRPRGGGGVALLRDLSGNDFYNAEIYAQGVGYWYSLGALIDEAGNDVYSATQYAQGAGIHLAAGVLEDMAGDDRYGSRFGPGQGGAHDLSVGVFYEHGGDDQYMISGGQGMAINNSAALMLDLAGNDAYLTAESEHSQGGVRDARDFGNMAVFIDGEGRDIYSSPRRSDSTAWLGGLYAIGLDAARAHVRPREAPVTVELVPGDTLRPISDLFGEAAEWEVTDNRIRVRRARLALNAIGGPAVRWVGTQKLTTLSSLERRAIVELCKAHSDSAAPYLFAALASDNRAARRNAVAVFGELKYRIASPELLAKLHAPGYEFLRPGILSALGEIADTSSTSAVASFAGSAVERERIAAAAALGKLHDPRAFAVLVGQLSDPSSAVRSAAIIAVAAQDAAVLGTLHASLSEQNPRQVESVLLAVGRLGARWRGDEQLRKQTGKLQPFVRRYLEHPDPRVQSVALAAAMDVLPDKELVKLTTRFRSAADPVVQARVREIEHKSASKE